MRQDRALIYDASNSRKLLITSGWSGEVTDNEAQYISAELSKSPELRRQWQTTRFFGMRWRKITPNMAARLCQNAGADFQGHSVASGGAG